MQRLVLTLLLLGSCGKAAPLPRVVAFGDFFEMEKWFHSQCSIPRNVTTMHDYSLLPGMEYVRVSTLPLRSDGVCGGKLANLRNLRVEMQGDGSVVCAVRLGPADALGPIDPTFIQDWFTDKQLGARARDLLGGSLDSSYQRMVMLDGIRIAVQLEKTTLSSQFFLIVDGCGRLPDANPAMSRF